MRASTRVSSPAERFAVLKKNVAPSHGAWLLVSRRLALIAYLDLRALRYHIIDNRAPLAYIASLVTKACFTPWTLLPTTLMGVVRTLHGKQLDLLTPGRLTIPTRWRTTGQFPIWRGRG
jgi:hypothetical protein